MRKLLVGITIIFLCLTQLIHVNAAEGEYQPVPKSPDTHPAYINKIFSKNGKTFLTADYIQWFEGEEANKVFREYEKNSGLSEAPDGYYIVNQNNKLRTFELADDAVVIMQVYNRTEKVEDVDIVWNERINIKKFNSLFINNDAIDLTDFPYHLTIKNNKIIKIVQQYIP
ncbi:MAG: hypothetical protein ACQEXQ_19535 [Bacillota bacterium]